MHRLKPDHFQIGGPPRQYTQTVNFGTVPCEFPPASEFGGLSVGCPAGPSVDSYNAPVSAI